MQHAAISVLILFLAVLSGCGPVWQYDYDVALRQARGRQRDLLVLFKDPLDAESGTARDALEAAAARTSMDDKVWCMLVPFHTPSRRFVAQYGILEAPAIIVVHPDSTYHALPGVRTEDEVAVFLKEAKAPGAAPNLNPQVPHRVTFPYFNVHERALDAARNQNRRLFIVYKWWVDGRSSKLIHRLSRPHVSSQFGEAVKCILDWDHIPNRRHVAKYGVTTFPAMIIVEPDGRHRVLPGVPTIDDIIRFATMGSERR